MPSRQLTRQWIVLQELTASRRGRTAAELARAAGVSARTVRRDLEDIEAAGFPVERVRDGREVRYRLLHSRSLPQIPLDLHEALALHQAAFTASVFHNAALHEPLESALRKVLRALPEPVRNYLGRVSAAWSHRAPGPSPAGLPHVLRVLAEQAADRCRVRIRYQNLEGEVRDRVVDPYVLRHHNADVYLLAYCHLRNEVRLFHAERILHVEPLDEEYRMPPGFDPDRVFAKSLGVFLGPAGHAVVRFTGWAARYVLHRPLHPDQQVLEQADARAVIRVPVRGPHEITHAVLRFGPWAEVLGPPGLRAHVAAQVRALAERYARPTEGSG